MLPLIQTPAAPATVEGALFLVFAAGVTAMTAFAFVIWVCWMALKLVAIGLIRLGVWPGRRAPHAKPDVDAVGRPCPDPVCRAVNPGHAGFCRHCGRSLVRRHPQL